MSWESVEHWVSDAGVWLIQAAQPYFAAAGLEDFLTLSDDGIDLLLDAKSAVLAPVVVFFVVWMVLRVALSLFWQRWRLARAAAWWRSLDYVWVLVVVVMVVAFVVAERHQDIRIELLRLAASQEAGVRELDARITRLQARCLWAGAGLATGTVRPPSEKYCNSAQTLRETLRSMRVAVNPAAAGVSIAGPEGRMTWREFALEVDQLRLHFPSDERMTTLYAMEDALLRQDDFGSGRTRWTAFGWMDQHRDGIVSRRAELRRINGVQQVLAGWPFLFALGLAIRFVKTAAERRLEAERRALAGLPTAVVEHFVTAMGGRYTYRVLASRQMTDAELQAAIHNALEEGHLREPDTGESATLVV